MVTSVDTVVPLDMNFYDSMWAEPTSVFDPDRIVVIFDHVVPAPSRQVGEALERGRAFAAKHGITRLHDVGPGQGICHQLIADVPYAMPGELLVCVDSHTCSGGALNCAAQGIGAPELIYVMAKGYTWFQVGETVRYELTGALAPHVTANDVFLHLADRYGAHVGQNVEFGGPSLANGVGPPSAPARLNRSLHPASLRGGLGGPTSLVRHRRLRRLLRGDGSRDQLRFASPCSYSASIPTAARSRSRYSARCRR